MAPNEQRMYVNGRGKASIRMEYSNKILLVARINFSQSETFKKTWHVKIPAVKELLLNESNPMPEYSNFSFYLNRSDWLDYVATRIKIADQKSKLNDPDVKTLNEYGEIERISIDYL